MATYKAIKGFEIQVQSSDPGTLNKGQVWYNTTSGTLKIAGAGGWSAGGNVTYGGGRAGSQLGLQTASLIFGGGPPTNDKCEAYNGTTWSEESPMPLTGIAGNSGAGTQTATMSMSGYQPVPTFSNKSFTYDGTSWTRENDMVAPGSNRGGGGPQAGAWCCGGYDGPSPPGLPTEDYDGTSWSSGGNLNTGRWNNYSYGSGSARITMGGDRPASQGISLATEEYNGSSWTAVNNSSTPQSGGSNIGSVISSCMAVGNYAPTVPGPGEAIVQNYDGTSWSAGTSLTVGRDGTAGGSGTTAAGLCVAGNQSGIGVYVGTEEYNDPSVTTITTST